MPDRGDDGSLSILYQGGRWSKVKRKGHMSDPTEFPFDVFMSHSAKDKDAVRKLAERLRTDGIRVWFDEWMLMPGDNIVAKIEEGLEQSRVLVFCMSANAFGSDWALLEAGTFRFRDPLNQERRFVPLRLDDSPIKGSLKQFVSIEWYGGGSNQEYARLLESCRPLLVAQVAAAKKTIRVHGADVDPSEARSYAFSSPEKYALVELSNSANVLIDLGSGQRLCERPGRDWSVVGVTQGEDGVLALSATRTISSKTMFLMALLRLWHIETRADLRWIHTNQPDLTSVFGSKDLRFALTGSSDGTLKLWDINAGECVWEVRSPYPISAARWNCDETLVVAGNAAGRILILDGRTGEFVCEMKSNERPIRDVAVSSNGRRLLSAAENSIRLWSVEAERCLRVFEGHTGAVTQVAWHPNGRLFLSGSEDGAVRLWDAEVGRCLRVLLGHLKVVYVAWSDDGRCAVSGDKMGFIQFYDLSEFIVTDQDIGVPSRVLSSAPGQIQYTNAKVLIVGDSGVGKTGLSRRLALDGWQTTDSTVGAWATQWKLPVSSDDGVEREIWLWDFGGQADQRLIHQLFMDDAALVILVFDGQKEDLFETLGQWDRDLTRAANKEFSKLLVAGRVDAGGLRVARTELEKFAHERKYLGFMQTSAKTNQNCQELKQAILLGIPWNEIPCRTTEILFKRLKEEIVQLRDEGRVLLRFNELREALKLRVSGESAGFSDGELRAVLTLLAGPGVVRLLTFGSWVLLQPERINAYGQAVVRTLQTDDQQRGCLPEEKILNGELLYESSLERLQGDEERFVLLAMHQTLVERGICLRQSSLKGNLLIFPSYYRRERPEQVTFPAVLLSYRFTGFLDEIYATLVVRLHHTERFVQDQLWLNAADFKTNTRMRLGVRLTRRASGMGELEVYFESAVSMEDKIVFGKYIHEHLLQYAQSVERLRHYVCSCGTPVGNRDVAMRRLNSWLENRPQSPDSAGWLLFRASKGKKPTIICVECEKQVALWDELEQCFASPEIQRRVRDMQEESKIVLDNESRERALVGEVISTVALAGQVCREKSPSYYGIDMEIEFKDDAGEHTGKRLFLLLKSENLYKKKKRDAEVFVLRKKRYIHHWMSQAFPVLLICRNSEGEVRWMEVRDWLKRASDNGKRSVAQIEFEGERFDVMSVRRWRERVLSTRTTSPALD